MNATSTGPKTVEVFAKWIDKVSVPDLMGIYAIGIEADTT